MVYSEVYNMMYEPDRYLGKRIKMNGQFAVYENPNTGAVYTACIIMDATACCSQGLEFVLAGEHNYPADYPERGTEITVVGTFQTYEENGYMDYHLVDAEMTE
jgi:exonuclease VII large subunit